MASVPGPDPDRPLPRPAAPEQEPEHEEEEQWESAPDEAPSWLPEPYDPSREHREYETPAVPL
ncbi:MAG: hypothetical protein WEE89_07160 [Gemmatimonadota bacterium]